MFLRVIRNISLLDATTTATLCRVPFPDSTTQLPPRLASASPTPGTLPPASLGHQTHQGGGEMIDQVHFTHSTYAEPPARFEAGTPAIAQAVGLGAACDYLSAVGMENVAAYEHEMSR